MDGCIDGAVRVVNLKLAGIEWLVTPRRDGPTTMFSMYSLINTRRCNRFLVCQSR